MSESKPASARSALSLAALGVVYGDIGTSPLYAMKEVFSGGHHPVPVAPDQVLGILSVIFWSLMLVVSLKYVVFVLRADNRGEGGIMALMALAQRPFPAGSRQARLVLVLGLIGAALFYGDGVITPAISVLSAVEGLEVATPALAPWVVPIALAILILLFSLQRRGTARVGFLFGPVMLVWFGTLGLLGLLAIFRHPAVLWALNPLHGLGFFLTNPLAGFLALGAVVLALTGAEALYADMGHFGLRPIQRAWFGLVLPALVLNYFGQGALLLQDPTAIANPFYRLAPDWLLYPLVLLATVATLIASQAVITGAFSISRQAIQLGFAPHLEINHTSDEQIGQVYLPAVNWTLLVAVATLVIGFGNSSNLAGAYGIAVTGTMFITDLLGFLVIRHLWGWSLPKSLLGALPFALIDLAFLSANSVKIWDGGWFPLLFGALVYLLMSTWKRGRTLLSARMAAEAMDMGHFVANLDPQITRIPGTAVFLTPNLDKVPHTLLHSLKHYQALHQQVVLASVQVLDVPYLGSAPRLSLHPLGQRFWQIRLMFGYLERPNVPRVLAGCTEPDLPLEPSRTSYVLGRETLIPKQGSEMCFWREKLFIALFRNAASAASFFGLPPNRVIELGTQVEL